MLFTSPDGVGVFIMPFCQRLNPECANNPSCIFILVFERPFLHCPTSRFYNTFPVTFLFSFNIHNRYGNPQPIIIPSSRCTSLKASGRGKCSCGVPPKANIRPFLLFIFRFIFQVLAFLYVVVGMLSLNCSARAGTVTYIGYDFHSNEVTSSLDHTKFVAASSRSCFL